MTLEERRMFLASCSQFNAKRIEVYGFGTVVFANAGSRPVESHDGFTEFNKLLFWAWDLSADPPSILRELL
jgi:hypothetical protein